LIASTDKIAFSSSEHVLFYPNISYDCPEFMRGRFMHNCSRLLEGMLCALICLDNESDLLVIFLEIHQRQSTKSTNKLGGLDKRAAVELSFPVAASFDDVLRITRQAQGLASSRLVLVEFPKLLYAGFYWTLRRLQQMQPYDVAFLQHIAPSLNGMAPLDNVAATKAASESHHIRTTLVRTSTAVRVRAGAHSIKVSFIQRHSTPKGSRHLHNIS
jgi:hypothetical protein